MNSVGYSPKFINPNNARLYTEHPPIYYTCASIVWSPQNGIFNDPWNSNWLNIIYSFIRPLPKTAKVWLDPQNLPKTPNLRRYDWMSRPADDLKHNPGRRITRSSWDPIVNPILSLQIASPRLTWPPENGPSQTEKSLPTIHFQVLG